MVKWGAKVEMAKKNFKKLERGHCMQMYMLKHTHDNNLINLQRPLPPNGLKADRLDGIFKRDYGL